MMWLTLFEVSLLIVTLAPKADAVICLLPPPEDSDRMRGPFPAPQAGVTVSLYYNTWCQFLYGFLSNSSLSTTEVRS